MAKIGVDPASLDLAEHFLSDTAFATAAAKERTTQSLAEHIQESVEDWFARRAFLGGVL